MSNIEIYKKPLLAVLSDEKKIRSYNNTERLTIAKNIIESLLNSLGVSNKSNEQHHIAAIKFIATDETYTPGEYSKAFELVFNGTLKVELFQQVNCLVIGKVMNLYRLYRNENLKVYKQKLQAQKYTPTTLTASEQKKLFIETLKDEFKNYKKTKTVNEMRNWLYNDLAKKITITPQVKTVIWKLSVKEIKQTQVNTRKRDRYTPKILKAKAIVNYKKNLIAQMFKNYTSIEQLLKIIV